MADAKTQVEQLTEELKLVETAIDPKTAGKSLQEYMDQNAEKDGLAGFGPPNAWKEAPRAESSCCVIS